MHLDDPSSLENPPKYICNLRILEVLPMIHPCNMLGGGELSILFQGTGSLLGTTSQNKTVHIPSLGPQ